jgi:hypothetical protein
VWSTHVRVLEDTLVGWVETPRSRHWKTHNQRINSPHFREKSIITLTIKTHRHLDMLYLKLLWLRHSYILSYSPENKLKHRSRTSWHSQQASLLSSIVLQKFQDELSRSLCYWPKTIFAKFEKYWGECNLLMAIATVLEPRFKIKLVQYCFPMSFAWIICWIC